MDFNSVLPVLTDRDDFTEFEAKAKVEDHELIRQKFQQYYQYSYGLIELQEPQLIALAQLLYEKMSLNRSALKAFFEQHFHKVEPEGMPFLRHDYKKKLFKNEGR